MRTNGRERLKLIMNLSFNNISTQSLIPLFFSIPLLFSTIRLRCRGERSAYPDGVPAVYLQWRLQRKCPIKFGILNVSLGPRRSDIYTPQVHHLPLYLTLSICINLFLSTQIFTDFFLPLCLYQSPSPGKRFSYFVLATHLFQAYVIGQNSSMASIMTIEPDSPSLTPSRSVLKGNLSTSLHNGFGWAKNLKKIVR